MNVTVKRLFLTVRSQRGSVVGAAGRLLTASAFVLLLGLTPAAPLHAGGFLETYDFTGRTPSPRTGEVIADVVPIRWDERCMPIPHRVNDYFDPIPNPLGGDFLSLSEATAVLEEAFETWNRIPTSYGEMHIEGTVTNPEPAGYDFVNELTFITPEGFDIFASSKATTLMEDTVLTDGMDMDGDGDGDVVAGLSVCTDIDGDGDLEWPAGFYRAGTILDNDVQFNTGPEGQRFTVGDAALDIEKQSVDLLAVAVHEFGHVLGLSHVMDNQLSDTDGTSATLYPFVDPDDPDDQLGWRTLSDDEVAYASLAYPEGSSNHGPAALQHGDIPFYLRYGLLQGSVEDGAFGGPLAGASVSARDVFTGRLVGAGWSGTTRVSLNLASGVPELISRSFSVVDGRWEIPVPLGLYQLRIEAPDGRPIEAGSINCTARVGEMLGQLEFHEEGYNGFEERAVERDPGRAVPVLAIPGLVTGGLDLVTNRQSEIANFGSFSGVGFTGAQPGRVYAVRFPGEEILARDQGRGLYLQAAEIYNFVHDKSQVPRWAEVLLTTGRVQGTQVQIDLGRPLRRITAWVGQEDDFSPFYFDLPGLLGRRVLEGIREHRIEDLFVVLRVPEELPFPGVSGLPPTIAVSAEQPLAGNSYQSFDGGLTFEPRADLDFWFKLLMTPR
jgi:hypothetical protein